ncbi:SDR family NAD(P)-dependent oxidoreductase [Herbaspirillum seropedicae]|uniref:3-oxoacyl-[acyl-carrier-protein] reductase protein n=1 Tax=Herbaspirillum seropedicae (strain SmR1) TaxID=757424 RepID=D8J120_HERSS|nr:SDR family NAD(P)-dependent oxidoreductase [Herbaspirillum seropedicae]ADJ62575.1 3-oxoacyl-[acyl-carrier-protein] reductase protein [Herbaspirillum seropedicae SmR1]AKN64687.1 short-chain dehydrogenase [Herbaspirillum seropedicae]AON53293.1 3-oxoacyl-ACP reductase [Herbaspirillum seropedicae]NQE30892.1 short-chain dehydrogenase [Herbaspirillum seropedicae]UMU20628.1 SDR family NAD(P)-dependent oxidoreductase [Herbaspirillum seropedicae]
MSTHTRPLPKAAPQDKTPPSRTAVLFGPMNEPMADLRGRRIWLIGASSGIGAELARQALAAGARVALSARRAEVLEEVAGAHPEAFIAPLDVLCHDAWRDQHARIVEAFGGVDLLIFCAARYRPERSWEVQEDEAEHTIRTNLASVYSALGAALPDMLARGSGGIALVASVAGYVGLPGATVYGPGKAALINLAEILYSDLRPKGVNVYLVNPGFVKTDLTDKNDFTMPALQTPQQAASAIWRGIGEGRFEIHFPLRFTAWLKLLRILPFRLRFMLFQRFLLS